MAQVLVVDDAEYMRRLIRTMLTKRGHTVIGEASNGPEAIELYSKLHPDIVIMDVLMPNVDGIKALKEIRATDPKAKVIMCTASEQSHHVEEAVASGASGYVVKPFTLEELLNEIQKIL